MSYLSNYLTFSFPFIASFSLTWAVFICCYQHFLSYSNINFLSIGLPILEFILFLQLSDVQHFLHPLRLSYQQFCVSFSVLPKCPWYMLPSPQLQQHFIYSNISPLREPHLFEIKPKARKVAKVYIRVHALKILLFICSRGFYSESVYI